VLLAGLPFATGLALLVGSGAGLVFVGVREGCAVWPWGGPGTTVGSISEFDGPHATMTRYARSGTKAHRGFTAVIWFGADRLDGGDSGEGSACRPGGGQMKRKRRP
jgi:hypothetical protein